MADGPKDRLTELVAAQMGTTKKEAGAAIDAVAASLKALVLDGTSINLAPLGKFHCTDKPARTARNPRTGEAVHVAAKRVITFKASKAGS